MLDKIKQLDLRKSHNRYIKLDGHYKAKCPFHKEKTASFKVYHDRWKCFGCGKTGDFVDFIKEYYGLDFKGACKKICEDFGIGDVRLSYKEKQKIETERRKRDEEKKREEKYWETYAIFAEYDKICERFRPEKGEEINNVWIMANEHREYYWEEILSYE